MAPTPPVNGPGLPAPGGEHRLATGFSQREEVGAPPVLCQPRLGRLDRDREPENNMSGVSVNLHEPTESVKREPLPTFSGPPEIDPKGRLELADRVVAQEADGHPSSASLENEPSMVPPDGWAANSKARREPDWDAEGFNRVMSGPIPAFLDGIEWLTSLGVLIVNQLEGEGAVVAPLSTAPTYAQLS